MQRRKRARARVCVFEGGVEEKQFDKITSIQFELRNDKWDRGEITTSFTV